MCDCNENPCKVLIERAVIAIKSHKCCECGRQIKVGETYQRINGVWADFCGTFKTCARCALLRKYLEALYREHNECGPCFTELADSIEMQTGHKLEPV